MRKTNISRRKFMGATGSAIALFNVVPSYVVGQTKEESAPSERLNIACVGVGGKGFSDLMNSGKRHNIVAICDADEVRGGRAREKYPQARFYTDWRKMYDKEANNIDAVKVSTPDHSHAPISMAAIHLGKHVYCQKPLTTSIADARALSKAAKYKGVCTQMGNQKHASAGVRLCRAWVQAGAIGDVREVHTWTNRPGWPQDILRPPAEDVPATMNWEAWIGPAPMKPYSSQIAPGKWRAYWDYGAGALGDMGAHIIDYPYWSLDLGSPISVEALKVERNTPGSEKDTYPQSTIIEYKFPARGDKPPVTMLWHDGNYAPPPHPERLEKERKLASAGGAIFFGSKHHLMMAHKGSPRVFPEAEMQEFQKPDVEIEKSPGHDEEWHQAILQNDPSIAKSNFDYAGPLTEVVLLGCLAQRMGQGVKLLWDSKNMKTDNAEANRYVHYEYRKGWELGSVG